MSLDKAFAAFATRTAKVTGSPWTFGVCLGLVLAWAASGPVFRFSETWQLVINTGTTIVTFLMVFLIQNTQNRDGEAIQAKLDELIVSSEAENAFVGIETLSDKELRALHQRCMARAKAHADAHARVTAEIGRRKGEGAAERKASRAKAPARKAAARRTAA
ncbi:low affinity iron permease family protein [Phenylobacterium sp.]|uniref:low affinity iron permease family protein n=1 Tax=Phenylobacterium sp. TaxID=1871053 RepID=UPI0025CC7C62|nr:low affinity iron permease family protein [Phenylobacterium sp.]MBX3484805.1 low affinity iron permease family protein [Phenylobacterium sp.]MCW5759074.1 low affinity iron permease family protein [Phenylobacterium sp.]